MSSVSSPPPGRASPSVRSSSCSPSTRSLPRAWKQCAHSGRRPPGPSRDSGAVVPRRRDRRCRARLARHHRACSRNLGRGLGFGHWRRRDCPRVNVAGNAGERALLGLAGLVSVAPGVVLVIRPDVGAVTLAQVYGLFSIVYGISSLVTEANLRMAVSPLRMDEPMQWS